MDHISYQSDSNKVSELLTTIWTENDDEILKFISRDKRFLDIYVNFLCMRSCGMLCEVCVKEGILSGCKECRQMVCCCAEELEIAPLSADDKQQLRRLCINAYIGACPHIICLLMEKNGVISESFLQDRMADYYTVVDMDYKAERVKSCYYRLYRETDLVVNAAAYPEHLLIRLGKIQVLSVILNKYTRKDVRVRWTFHHEYTELHLALLFNEIKLFMTEIKRKFMPRLMLSYGVLDDEGCREANILHIAMSRDAPDAFCQILKVMKKVQRFDYSGKQQRILNGALWGSIKDSKLEYTRMLLQSNMLNLCEKNPKVDRNRELALSMIIQNNNDEVLDILLKIAGFEAYFTETLTLTVALGNVRVCEKLLCEFTRLSKTPLVIDIDVYTLAVLHNQPDMLGVLLKHKIQVIHMKNIKFSALDFAIRLQREKCCEILISAGQKSLENTADTSPLLEIQKLGDPQHSYHKFFTRTLSFVNLVEELLGFNVNFEDQNGMTPVQMAIKRFDYDTVRLLLQTGADLFRGQSFMLEYGTMRLITEIFYCNVNTYNHLSTILDVVVSNTRFTRRSRKNWALQKIDREQLTYSFIADCVHSLSTRDRVALAKYYKTDDYHVRTLEYLCRVTIRRRFGIHIHKYVNLVFVPESIKRFLLVSDEIDTFQSLIGWKRES